jgi:hypothetical protein
VGDQCGRGTRMRAGSSLRCWTSQKKLYEMAVSAAGGNSALFAANRLSHALKVDGGGGCGRARVLGTADCWLFDHTLADEGGGAAAAPHDQVRPGIEGRSRKRPNRSRHRRWFYSPRAHANPSSWPHTNFEWLR